MRQRLPDNTSCTVKNPTVTKVISVQQFKDFCKKKQMKFMFRKVYLVIRVAGKEEFKEIARLKERIKLLEAQAEGK